MPLNTYIATVKREEDSDLASLTQAFVKAAENVLAGKNSKVLDIREETGTLVFCSTWIEKEFLARHSLTEDIQHEPNVIPFKPKHKPK